ncbi:cysteine hydrolase family protein [Rhizobium sp. BR 315]|uniref:cysteine hydrolase family protein n=1 Tax=Rhizobium sp. BR 315 TaxID=3040014 RepID=UPI003D3412BF
MAQQCLLIIDFLNDYLDRWDPKKVVQLITQTNKVVASFRERGLPVIWVRTEFRADLSDAFLEMRDGAISIVIEGGRGSALHEQLDWQATDKTIVKKRYSAFFGTDLHDYLTERGIEKILICGINTHACIRMAAIDAYQRDLRVVLLSDCIGSYDDEHSRVSVNYMRDKIAAVTTSNEVIASATMAM